MKNIQYINLQDIDRTEFLKILNNGIVRKHLVLHNVFNENSLDEWINGKIKVNETRGCKVRGIVIDGALAGWCGIQFENENYELAIILDEKYWGMGVPVFKEIMKWASELGHTKVVLNLFNTRPEYEFLRKMALRVYESTLYGQKYTSYEIAVPHA